MVMDTSTRRWALILPKFDEPFGPRFHSLEKFWGNRCWSMRTLGSDKMGEYLHPHVELKTPRVYTMVGHINKEMGFYITKNSTNLSF
jgi:hypothetical protein